MGKLQGFETMRIFESRAVGARAYRGFRVEGSQVMGGGFEVGQCLVLRAWSLRIGVAGVG